MDKEIFFVRFHRIFSFSLRKLEGFLEKLKKSDRWTGRTARKYSGAAGSGSFFRLRLVKREETGYNVCMF